MEDQQKLPTLPYELVTQIGSNLCSVEELNSLRALSQLTQTCRALRVTFQPLLFQSYSHYSQPVSRLVAFLRTIVSRPDLAAAVTTLIFWDPLSSTSLNSIDKLFIETCIRNIGLSPPAGDWHIEGSNRHIPIEAVLAYTPNIESLTIPVNEDWALDLLLAFAGASPKMEFPRLRYLSIYYYYISGDHWAINYGQIQPLLEASPHVEHLALPTLEGFWEDSGNARIPPLKSVTTLDLGESSSGMFFITSIIRACGPLRKFSLCWIRSSGYDESHEDWNTLEVWDALALVKDTIEEIIFEPTTEIPLGTPTLKSVSSLSGFTKLRTLKVDGRCLQGMLQAWTLKTGSSDMDDFVRQLFPSGLHTLAIWSPGSHLIPALLALAKARSNGVYTDLVSVEVGASPVFKHWLPRPEWSSNEAELRGRFGAAGMELKMEIPYVPPEFLNLALQMGLA
ncbi:hypothetical protein BJY01DRAFT_247637 [Aspergillus pseudoustus]|uniref:F-box domain-containing protein n=1 Tax=Aspergillus pseudoustus TaxID=1810923 RepID=A0ABR4JZH7_9EURO